MKNQKHLIALLGMLLVPAAAAAISRTVPAETAVVTVIEDIAQYTGRQIFVLYTDGSSGTFEYEDEDALAEALVSFSSDDSVAVVSPNYTYTSTSLTTDDPLLEYQWALYNDGSFTMEEQKNRHPVYDDPFGSPSAPGQWMEPQPQSQPFMQPGFGRFRGFASYSAMQTTTALSGIDINLAEAWEIYDGGSREVIIAQIDTGVDYNHEDLSSSIWVNTAETADGTDSDGNGYIDDIYGWNFYHNNNQVYTGSQDSHGTHGAGTMMAAAGNASGIAGIVQSDNVKLMILKALGGADGSGSTASVVAAIQYAEANGASICNLSMGTSQHDEALYQVMANSSMLFVVSAGNDGADCDVSPSYPAAYDLDNIISVANLSFDGSLSSSSNYGAASVDLAAPGTYILSTTPENSYSYMSGTSMSTPVVTAAAAMIYSYYENITLADVKEILLSSTCPLSSLEGLLVTGGMLDLGAAMQYDLSQLSQ